jgi:hypothetical protein
MSHDDRQANPSSDTGRPRSMRRRLIALGSIVALGLVVVLGQGVTGRATGDSAGGCGGSESEMINSLTEGKGLSGHAAAVSHQLNLPLEEVLRRRQEAQNILQQFKASGASPDHLPEDQQSQLLEVQQTLGLLTKPNPDADPAAEVPAAQKAGLVKPTAEELALDKSNREGLEAQLRDNPLEGAAYDALKAKVLGN